MTFILEGEPHASWDSFGFYPEGAEVSKRSVKEVDRTVLAFIRHDAGKGDPGSVIDGDMDIFPTSALAEIAAIAGDAVTGPLAWHWRS